MYARKKRYRGLSALDDLTLLDPDFDDLDGILSGLKEEICAYGAIASGAVYGAPEYHGPNVIDLERSRLALQQRIEQRKVWEQQRLAKIAEEAAKAAVADAVRLRAEAKLQAVKLREEARAAKAAERERQRLYKERQKAGIKAEAELKTRLAQLSKQANKQALKRRILQAKLAKKREKAEEKERKLRIKRAHSVLLASRIQAEEYLGVGSVQVIRQTWSARIEARRWLELIHRSFDQYASAQYELVTDPHTGAIKTVPCSFKLVWLAEPQIVEGTDLVISHHTFGK